MQHYDYYFWSSIQLGNSGFLGFGFYQRHPLRPGPLSDWAGSSGRGSLDQITRPRAVAVVVEGIEQSVVDKMED